MHMRRFEASRTAMGIPGAIRECSNISNAFERKDRETELLLLCMEFVVERLADYVDTGTTIWDIVTRYPLSPKMIACACCADLRDGSSMAP